MNMFVVRSPFTIRRKQTIIQVSSIFPCIRCFMFVIVKIRDNWKWDSFALSNSMHARFNIYNGSCIKTTKNTTTEPHKTSDDDERNNHNNKQYASVHIIVRSVVHSFVLLFICTFINFSLGFHSMKNKNTLKKKSSFCLKFWTPENVAFCRKNTFCTQLFTAGRTIHF